MTLSLTAKRIIIFGIILTTTLGIALAIIFLFLVNPPTVDEGTEEPPVSVNGLTPADPSFGFNFRLDDILAGITSPTAPTIPNVAQGGEVLTAQLTTSRIVSPTLVNGNQVQFYEPNDGRFYRINPAGELEAISEAVFPEAETVVFAESGNTAVIEFPDGNNIVYDFETDKQTTLPAHWREFDLSKDGSTVVSKSFGVNQDLVTVGSDGTGGRVVTDMGNNADEVKINISPNNETLAFSETGTAQSVFGRQEIFLIAPDGEASGRIIVDGTNFSPKWSPSGEALIYSVADQARNERPALWFVNTMSDQIGSGRKNLQLETWAEKCTFKDEVTLLCAVPREVPDYSGADYRFVTSPDDVYQVNVTSGRITMVGSPVANHKMFNLTISQDLTLLYFTDEYGQLHSMRLK